MNPLEQIIDLFLAKIRLEGSLSAHTATNYAVDLAQFSSFLEKNEIKNVQEVGTREIKSYLREMSGWYAKASVARKLSALRGMFEFAKDMGVIERNPMRAVRGIAAPRPVPRAVSRESVEKMLALAGESENPERDTLIFEILYGAGLRVSELVSLSWDDIDTVERWLVVRGKGDKERRVPFGQYAGNALFEWKKTAGEGQEKFLFPGKRGEKTLNVRTVHRIVTGIARQAGAFSVTPHVLRHSCATHLLEGGASLKFIQEFLGHENLSTTQVYLTISAARMKESYVKAHPRAEK